MPLWYCVAAKVCGGTKRKIMRKTTWILIAVAIVVWAASQAGWI